ncbi:protein GPR15LG [Bos taurus]|nr:protein GPR15LG [Bos taurus]
MRIPSALPTGKHLYLCCSIKFPGGPKGGLLQHSSLPRSRGSWLATMRLLILTSLLCILLLCLSVFSAEGRSHLRHHAKPGKGKPCCPRIPGPDLMTQKGHRTRNCRPCKLKSKHRFWVVPGALPQV